MHAKVVGDADKWKHVFSSDEANLPSVHEIEHVLEMGPIFMVNCEVQLFEGSVLPLITTLGLKDRAKVLRANRENDLVCWQFFISKIYCQVAKLWLYGICNSKMGERHQMEEPRSRKQLGGDGLCVI